MTALPATRCAVRAMLFGSLSGSARSVRIWAAEGAANPRPSALPSSPEAAIASRYSPDHVEAPYTSYVAPRGVAGPVERTVLESPIQRQRDRSRFVERDSIETAPDGTGR
ncbi:hypothetical protein P9139_20390 [Curtobacterium flaccumfaciens]|nr:hypothetical protein P9139_20390 [Curtobacterium flaccumfaciens]